MTEEIRSLVRSLSQLPESLRQMEPRFTESIFDESYLDFPRGEIQLGARGPKWSAVLSKRLESYKPFVNKLMVSAVLYDGRSYASIRIDPVYLKVINLEVEVYEKREGE